MIDFVQLQHIMKDQLEQDRTIRTVDVAGPTLEAAIAEAATLLNLSVRRIEYEITERGFPGFLGVGKRDWKIQAYPGVRHKKEAAQEILVETSEEATAPVIVDKDGDVFVHLRNEGAFLKVVPPVGNGAWATEDQAMAALKARNVTDIDETLVSRVTKQVEGNYVQVGTFNRKYTSDSMISVNITDENMKAYISVTPPGIGGCDLEVETIITMLKDNRVVYGIKEDFLHEFVDRPTYKLPVLVAEGNQPVNGRDAYMQYNFQTNQSKVRFQPEMDGRVDFKELNRIQNVVANQPLAKKIPAEEGTRGRTVMGSYIPAKKGNDIELPLGTNVHAGEDGETVLGDINGQVTIVAGKITVEPILTIQGNVNIKTGNIMFLGNVVVSGNVEDGYSVKASGNIEINGNAEKAELVADGYIVVRKGITGKSANGIIHAGGSLWARFIENAVVESGGMVVASDGIVNCQVDALRRIVCQGKRARIVGGCLRASEEINAKVIGSSAGGTETTCEVGIDPKIKGQLNTLTANKVAALKEIEQIKLDFQTLSNILQQRKSLPPDKEAYMQELQSRQRTLVADLKKINEDMGIIQQSIGDLKVRGRVSAAERVYPGVKIIILDAIEKVQTEYKAVTFILENDLIRVTKYEEPDDEAKRGPDGYTAN
ncbi:MAG: FapA family protein [Treponema sp.]|jgi:uncharacterized protein (DUF342 family)|nr:FapA family protein [Treponema sp.]